MNRNNFIYKVEAAFNHLQYSINDFKEFFNMDIDDMLKFITTLQSDIDDFKYELFEFELRLRALRDKLENN